MKKHYFEDKETPRNVLHSAEDVARYHVRSNTFRSRFAYTGNTDSESVIHRLTNSFASICGLLVDKEIISDKEFLEALDIHHFVMPYEEEGE